MLWLMWVGGKDDALVFHLIRPLPRWIAALLDDNLHLCYNVFKRKSVIKEERPMMSDPAQPRIQANMFIHNIGQLVTVAQQPLPGAYGPLQIINTTPTAVLNANISWIGRKRDYD